MNTLNLSKVIILLIALLNSYSLANADVIYESATMGSAGQSIGSTIYADQIQGSRFYISQKVQVTAIGGHMGSWGMGNIFGAIVKLDSFTDFPNGNPSDGTDFIACKVFTPSYNTSDYRTSLSAELLPGYYALVFGSGMYGATGRAVMAFTGQTDLSASQYFRWDGDQHNWRNSTINPVNSLRFVVEGTVVPEPATLLLLGLGGIALRRKK